MENEEYEIQYFGFSAEQLQREFRQLFEHHVNKLSIELAESLIKTLNVENRDEILSKTNEVVKNITDSTEEISQQIDKLIKHTIQIPKNVTLPEDKPKAVYTEDDELDLNCKVEVLLKYYKQNAEFMFLLDQELEMYNKLEYLIYSEEKIVDKVCETFKVNDRFLENRRILATCEEIFKKEENETVLIE